MSSLVYRPAKRQDSKPLIGLYGLSGTGKTYSSLLLARGIVGPNGRIALIDTESGRGSLYADVIPGGYDVLELGEPFSPARYIEAMDVAFKSGAGVLVIDSLSHEWENVGGVTDMAAEIERRTGKSGLHCWKEPKIQHMKMVLKLLQSPIPVICCLRAKRKSRQVKDEKGKTVIVKDDFASPKQDGDFIFECTVHAEVMQDHTLRVTKVSHPGLVAVFASGKPVTVHTGEALAEWAKGNVAAHKPAEPPPPSEDAIKIAEAWCNDKIRWIDTAPGDKIDAALAKWQPRLAEIHKIAPDAAMAVVDAADTRKRALGLVTA